VRSFGGSLRLPPLPILSLTRQGLERAGVGFSPAVPTRRSLRNGDEFMAASLLVSHLERGMTNPVVFPHVPFTNLREESCK